VKVVVNLQDKMNKLKKKALARWHLKDQRQDTVVARRTVINGDGQALCELPRLLRKIRIGVLIMTRIILVLVLAAHGGVRRGNRGILVL